MSHVFVKDLKPGVGIRQFFVVRKAESRTTVKGDPFLNLILADRTGTVNGKVWSDNLPLPEQNVRKGIIAGVQGRVELFQDEPQINVKYIADVEFLKERGRDTADLNMEHLLLSTPFGIREMWDELQNLVREHIEAESLRNLVLELLNRNEERFREAPAAVQYHHAYRGGLLEHTLKVLRYALALAEQEPDLDRDILVAGAVLHDVGKVREIQGTIFPDRSVEGRLLGHLMLGGEMVREVARDLNMDPQEPRLLHLQHIILSHHGELEFGSPVVAKSREALVVHFLDDLNAKLKMIEEHIRGTKEAGEFTDYHRVLRRSFYRAPRSGQTDDIEEPDRGREESSPED